MYRFFITPDQLEGPRIRITGEDVNHIKNVLRMKHGEEIRISDGTGRDYFCRIESIETEQVTAKIVREEQNTTELPSRIVLFQGLPKGDKMEWIIQKTVELGVSEIVPVSCRRCVVKLDPKKEEGKLRRWNTISESAAKQSKRLIIPRVMPVMTLKEAIAYGSSLDIRLIPYENENGMQNSGRLIKDCVPGKSAGILIGPEGGFDGSEVEYARACGWNPISLGKRILRTETAGMMLLSVLMFRLETFETDNTGR